MLRDGIGMWIGIEVGTVVWIGIDNEVDRNSGRDRA